MKVAPNQKKPPTKKAGTNSSKKTKNNDGASKKSAQQLILELTAESYSLGEDSLPRDRLTQGTGLAAKTVVNNLTKLKKQGLIEYPDAQSLRLTTPKGVQAAGSLAQAPATNAERHERLKKNLKGKQIALFDLLADGGARDRDDVARALGYENKRTKAFENVKGKLSGQGLLSYPDNQTMQLADLCFPFGREAGA